MPNLLESLAVIYDSNRMRRFILSEFAPAVAELPDILGQGKQSLDQIIAHPQEILSLAIEGKKYHDIAEMARYLTQTGNLSDFRRKNLPLGVRLYKHDLKNLHAEFYGQMQLLELDPDKIDDAKFASGLLCLMANFRLFGITMGYLASDGNEKYTSKIFSPQIPCLLNAVSGHGLQSSSIQESAIRSPVYIAIFEAAKNTPTPYRLVIKKGANITISIHDDGKGICYYDCGKEKPLPLERLPEIFEGFTTRADGGLGLQVAKRLIELRNGHIVVETKTDKSPFHFVYSTETGVPCQVLTSGKTGTTFTFCVPSENSA